MKTRNEVKDRVQRDGLNKWFTNGMKGTLEYATGVGKSRCGVLAAEFIVKHNPEARILVLTPTQVIRDNAWKEEFAKWGCRRIYNDNVEAVCIQTAYKYENEHYDLVIADEVHNYVPLEDEYSYFSFFENNEFDRILGLSASIDEELIPRLNTIAPIVDTIDVNKAVELGLVSPFKLFNIEIELTSEEQEEYDKANKEFNRTFPIFNRNLGFMFQCMKNAGAFKRHVLAYFGATNVDATQQAEIWKRYKNYPYRCNRAIKQRKQILYGAAQKLDVIQQISDLLQDKKGIIFSEASAFADKVGENLGDICVVEHSKIRPAKKRRENLKKFQDGRTKVTRIAAVKSLNEGANLKGVMWIIIASGTSKLKDFIQRVGRSIRWEDGKTALIFRLCVKDSQEQRWVESSQGDQSVVNVSSVEDLRKYLIVNEID